MSTLLRSPNVLPFDGEACLIESWLAREEADQLWAALLEGLDWRQEHATFFGRSVPLPRLTAWYGDVGYHYSGVAHPPAPWPQQLAATLSRVRELGPANSVLANLYRHGQDSMGWHSDDEPQFGANPTIWSLSLGAPRRFCFRHRSNGHRLEMELRHGSLVIMSGACQQFWHHSVPKTATPTGPRISLTFRNVLGEEGR